MSGKVEQWRAHIDKVVEETPLDTYRREDIKAWKIETLETKQDEVKGHIRVALMRAGSELGSFVPIRDMDAVVDVTFDKMLQTLREESRE